MKKSTLILMAAAALMSCKKQTVTPAPPVAQAEERLFNFRVAGFKSNATQNDTASYVRYGDKYSNTQLFGPILVVDTCQITVNGVLTYAKTYGYHRTFKKGDVIGFYIVGKIDSSAIEHSFAIWEDKNALPVVNSFYAVGNKITGQYIIN